MIESADFVRWIERSLERQENVLATSNQGTLLKFEGAGLELVVKCPMGRGLLLRARRRTLLREHQAYRRMDGLEGVPRCCGLAAGQYLALEFIRGRPYREAVWTARDRWFEEFLAVIRSFHGRGVSHGDLKSKSNILVTEDERPCVVDFGTSFVLKAGFHPINNRMFEYGKRLDLNAWVKHKYHGRYADATEEDRKLLNYSTVEYLVRRARGGAMK